MENFEKLLKVYEKQASIISKQESEARKLRKELKSVKENILETMGKENQVLTENFMAIIKRTERAGYTVEACTIEKLVVSKI